MVFKRAIAITLYKHLHLAPRRPSIGALERARVPEMPRGRSRPRHVPPPIPGTFGSAECERFGPGLEPLHYPLLLCPNFLAMA
jgi:hypothetical protein